MRTTEVQLLQEGMKQDSLSPNGGAVSVTWKVDACLTRSDLVSFLDLLGFAGAYDDVHVVLDASGLSTGTAVVMFHTMVQAWAFQSLVHGKVGKVFGNAAQPCIAVVNDNMNNDGRGAANPENADAQDLILNSLLNYFQEATQKAEQSSLVAEPLAQGPTTATVDNLELLAEFAEAPPQSVVGGSPCRVPTPELEGLPPPPGLARRCVTEDSEWPAGVTTAMIRHIACRFAKEDVAEVLDSLGFQGRYDGIRVPRRPMTQSNLGYAFVNFFTPGDADLCRRVCHGRTFGQSFSAKLCEVVPAHIQGALSASPKARQAARRRSAKKAPTPPEAEADFVLAEAVKPAATHADLVNVVWISV